MIYDNDKFTDEQRRIISEIGIKNKKKFDRKKKLGIVQSIYSFLLFVVLGVIMYMLNDGEITIPLIIVGAGIFLGVSNIFKTGKKLKDEQEIDDYQIGLRYAGKDVEVIGNSKKALKQTRLGMGIFLGILGCLLIPMLAYMAFSGEMIEYSNLDEVTGILVEGYTDSDGDLFMKFEGDEVIYKFTSMYVDVLDVDAIFDEIELGDEITVYADDPFDGTNDVFRNSYYLESKGIEYMNHDLMEEAYIRNQNLGLMMFWGAIIVFVGVVVFYFTYIRYTYEKNLSKEKYDLSIKYNPIANSDGNDVFDIKSVKRIETYASKAFIGVVIGLNVFSIIATVLAIIFIEDITDKLIAFLIGIVFIVFSVMAYIDVTKHNEILEGQHLIVNRFFKTKMIFIGDIRSIQFAGVNVSFLNKDGDVLTRIAAQTKNLDKIIEELERTGVIIESVQRV